MSISPRCPESELRPIIPIFKTTQVARGCPGEKKVSKKRGYTLTEIIITIVILAVLAAVAIPNFSQTVAKADIKQVIASLQTIRAAQKMYYAKNGEYACQATPQAPTPCSDAAAIRTELRAEVEARGYSFSVTATASAFTATASGGDAGTFTINQAGDFTKDGEAYTVN